MIAKATSNDPIFRGKSNRPGSLQFGARIAATAIGVRAAGIAFAFTSCARMIERVRGIAAGESSKLCRSVFPSMAMKRDDAAAPNLSRLSA